MSVHAGEILHLAGNNVIDRIQSAGLGDVRLPIETIREVGNREVVDKVPGEPDFTFTLDSLNTSTELMAWLTGETGAEASGSAPGAAAPDGTVYNWLDCKPVNIISPWKDPDSGAAGNIEAGHIVPAYYPTRIRYRFGVTDNATQEVELSGGAFYYAAHAPVEQFETGDGADTTFVTDDPAVAHREGGADGTTFKYVFGVMVDGVVQSEDVEYSVTGGADPDDPATAVTITFEEAPANGADIRFVYFTTAAQAYPQAVHADTVVLPGAVRGKNIVVLINDERVAGLQSTELEATVDGEVERELGNTDPTGRSVNGTDCTGSLTLRAKDKDAFFDVLSRITGVDEDEVFGWFNTNHVDLKILIENPKNPGQILKTLWVEDAQFQPPGTPARVNAPTDFSVNFESLNGTFKEVKGEVA